MKAYEAVVECLAVEECRAVFGLIGDGNMRLWAALVQAGRPALYSVRHEAAAVSMADGYAQETGQVGVATVTCGPGLTHVATTLLAAGRAQTPLIVIAGQTAGSDLYNTQRLDQRRFVEACEAHFVSPSGPDDVPRVISEAYVHARTRRQPVVVSLPNDLQLQELKGPFRYRPSSVLMPHVCDLAPRTSLDELYRALKSAKYPVIIAGRGALHAVPALVRLGDRIGALLGTTLLAKDCFRDHPFNIGIVGGYIAGCVRPLMDECDFVLAVGAKLGFDTAGQGDPIFAHARVARIDLASAPSDVSVLPGMYLQGDAAKTVEALSHLFEQDEEPAVGFQKASVRDLLRTPSPTLQPPADGLDPRAVMRAVSGALPEGQRVIIGGGHFWNFPVTYLSLPRQGRVYFTYPFGSIGAALAIAMGVQIGQGRERSLVIDGDGSLLQHIQEMETAVRYRLPIVLLLLNDAGYGAEAHKLRASGIDGAPARWDSPDFVSIARAFGADGVRVTSQSDVLPAISAGFQHDGLFLVDVRTSPSLVAERYQQLYFGAANQTPLIRAGE